MKIQKKKEDESILSFDNVKDICIYINMNDSKENEFLFALYDYKNFIEYKKKFYINYFFGDKETYS